MYETKEEKLPDTSFFLMRHIPDIEHHLTDAKAQKFIDIQGDSNKDEEAQNLLEELKDKKLPQKVPTSNLVQVRHFKVEI